MNSALYSSPARRSSLSSAILGLTGALAGFSTHAMEQGAFRPGQPEVITQPARESSQDRARRRRESEVQSLAAFRSAYRAAGEPSVAVFWNRRFDDQLSQWYATQRRSITGEAGYDIRDTRASVDVPLEAGSAAEQQAGSNGGFAPSGGSIEMQGRVTRGGSRIISSENEEVRVDQQERQGMGEVPEFEFAAGLTGALLANGVKVVDRAAIMRLVERDNAKLAGAEMIADYQKIETDALIGYANLIAEIVFASDGGTGPDLVFLVTVKEVATGRVLTMFSSSPNIEVDQPAPAWVATDRGYERAAGRRTSLPPAAAAERVATQMMSSLAGVL